MKKLNEIYDLIISKIEHEVISEAMRLVISNKKEMLRIASISKGNIKYAA